MKNFLQIAQQVDVMPVRLAITRQPDMWKEDTYLRNYPQGPFGQIDSIICRFPPRANPTTEEELKEYLASIDQHECVDYPVYKRLPEARSLVMGLMHLVGGERLGRVIINRVMPGGRIDAHADTDDHARYWDRFHIAIASMPGVQFKCGDEEVWMPPGTAWWFQNAEVHEVINNSPEERIHMVVDIRTSK